MAGWRAVVGAWWMRLSSPAATPSEDGTVTLADSPAATATLADSSLYGLSISDAPAYTVTLDDE